MQSRRVRKRGMLDCYDDGDTIMIIDSACDQSMIPSTCCRVLESTSQYFYVDGAMPGMRSSAPLQVKNVCVLITNPYSNIKLIGIINQALYINDDSHYEALLQPHQARSHGTAVDDCARFHQDSDGNPGKQCIKVPGFTIPLLHDGLKAYLKISKPSQDDLKNYPIVELTSPAPYNPSERLYTRRVGGCNRVDIEVWRKRLGYQPNKVVKNTLLNTTQLVKTVEEDYRNVMRDHRLCCLFPLCPHRLNDVCYSDTFSSNVTLVRGYKCFQLFSLRDAKVDYPYLMKQKSQAPDMFSDFVRHVGAPNYMINDHAQELIGDDWLAVARHAIIDTHISEPEHQNENLAERRGGALKDNLQVLFMNTPCAPFAFW